MVSSPCNHLDNHILLRILDQGWVSHLQLEDVLYCIQQNLGTHGWHCSHMILVYFLFHTICPKNLQVYQVSKNTSLKTFAIAYFPLALRSLLHLENYFVWILSVNAIKLVFSHFSWFKKNQVIKVMFLV